MVSAAVIASLSSHQRYLLLRHIDGPVRIKRTHWPTFRILFRKKLIKNAKSYQAATFPEFSALTTTGRWAVAAILGEYADALISAGCLEREIKDRIALIAAPAPKPAITGEVPPELPAPPPVAPLAI